MRQAATQAELSFERPARQLRVVRGFGGGPPSDRRVPPVSNGQLAVLIVIVFELMIFAGLIAAYTVLRTSSLAWPPPSMPRLPLVVTWANTGVLTFSAFTMWRSVQAARRGQPREMRAALSATGIAGSLFLLVQGTEWVRLIGQGLTLSSGSYGGTFYTLIGLHALHVVAAVVWLGAVLGQAWRGDFSAKRRAGVALCAMYWYFVCALWLVLFPMVYLY